MGRMGPCKLLHAQSLRVAAKLMGRRGGTQQPCFSLALRVQDRGSTRTGVAAERKVERAGRVCAERGPPRQRRVLLVRAHLRNVAVAQKQ